jgi:thiol-disulfide isomerase/thioredoxin
MTDKQDVPQIRADRKGRASPATVLAAVVAAVFGLAAVTFAVLYGMSGSPRKESSAAAQACRGAAEAAMRLTPLARGEVAAFTVARTPKPATELSFLGPEGQPRKLSDFRGRTVLVNLWATWCVPCREEMPALDQLQAKLGGTDFEVVAINIDTARLERRQQFLNEIGVKSLAFYADPAADVFQTLKRSGRVVGLPTTMLVDPEGCDLGVLAGAAEWASDDAIRLIEAARKPAS